MTARPPQALKRTLRCTVQLSRVGSSRHKRSAVLQRRLTVTSRHQSMADWSLSERRPSPESKKVDWDAEKRLIVVYVDASHQIIHFANCITCLGKEEA